MRELRHESAALKALSSSSKIASVGKRTRASSLMQKSARWRVAVSVESRGTHSV